MKINLTEDQIQRIARKLIKKGQSLSLETINLSRFEINNMLSFIEENSATDEFKLEMVGTGLGFKLTIMTDNNAVSQDITDYERW